MRSLVELKVDCWQLQVNGYEASHGIIHHRKLYLSTGGGNLRGQTISNTPVHPVKLRAWQLFGSTYILALRLQC